MGMAAPTNQNITHKLISTRKDMLNINADLARNQAKTNKLMQKLQKAEEKISNTAKDLYNIANTLQQEKKLYQGLQANFVATNAKHKANQAILSKQLRLAHSLGQIPPIKLLLGQATPNNITRLLKYYGYIHTYQAQQLKNSTAILQELQALQVAKQQKITKINTIQASKTSQIQQLKKNNAARGKLLVAMNHTITQKHRTLMLLQRDEKALEQAIVQLQHKTAQSHHNQTKPRSPAKTALQNKVIFNQMTPHKPIVSNATKIKMRAISSANANRFLIQADLGSKVYAVQDGKIIFANWLRGYGLLLIIEHNNDLMSLYGHNQTLLKSVGEKVAKGEAIALVGQSGGQRLPGLYFEIRKAAKSINIRNWFNYETI